MTIYTYVVDNTTNIKIWNNTGDTCVVQEFKNGDKSKKATAKIKTYNGRRYIVCKGHRYYLDRFAKIEL